MQKYPRRPMMINICKTISNIFYMLYPKKSQFLSYPEYPIHHYMILVGGIPTPLKNDGVKVSWDDEIPNGKS